MNFKLRSIKIKDEEGGNLAVCQVETQSGSLITTTVAVKNLPALETLEIDVTREIKQELRKALHQLELRDESAARKN